MSGTAVAIGNFDGVHLGHQALLRATIEYAKAHGLESRLLTFDPHPTVFTAPDRVPRMLTTLDERIRLAKQTGVGDVEVLPFTTAVACLSADEFVRQILLERLNAKAVFVGENFRFAARREGTPEVLRALGERYGFTPHFLPPVMSGRQIVSSTCIREHLLAGRVSRANRLLGRCFALQGPVVSGFGIGSKQTVPTLNLKPPSTLLIPLGVFITETVDLEDGRRWHSITNAGTRPTFEGQDLTVETFLLDAFTPPTPRQIRVEFHRFIRSERAYPDPAALKAQILRDVSRAQTYWRRAARLKTAVASVY